MKCDDIFDHSDGHKKWWGCIATWFEWFKGPGMMSSCLFHSAEGLLVIELFGARE